MIYQVEGAPFIADIGYASRVGGDHLNNGIPNQDAAGSGAKGAYVFGAVADGVSDSSVFKGLAGYDDMPTASGLAVGAFVETVGEMLANADPSKGENLDWVTSAGLVAANSAIRKAKQERLLPPSAATTIVGAVGSLATGNVGVVYLGDPGLAEETNRRGELRNILDPHTDGDGNIAKVLKGQDEAPVPGRLTIPTLEETRQVVLHTDGMRHVGYFNELRSDPSLAGFPQVRAQGDLIAEALRVSNAQVIADSLVTAATVTVPRLLTLDGMSGGDDASALVLRMSRRS